MARPLIPGNAYSNAETRDAAVMIQRYRSQLASAEAAGDLDETVYYREHLARAERELAETKQRAADRRREVKKARRAPKPAPKEPAPTFYASAKDTLAAVYRQIAELTARAKELAAASGAEEPSASPVYENGVRVNTEPLPSPYRTPSGPQKLPPSFDGLNQWEAATLQAQLMEAARRRDPSVGVVHDQFTAANPTFARQGAASTTFTPEKGFDRSLTDEYGEVKYTDSDAEGYQQWHRMNRGHRLSMREYMAQFGGGR